MIILLEVRTLRLSDIICELVHKFELYLIFLFDIYFDI